MFGGLFAKEPVPEDSPYEPRRLLIIDSVQYDVPWETIFEGGTLPCGSNLEIVVCGWPDICCTAYPNSQCICTIRRPGIGQRPIQFTPDAVLVRNEVREIKDDHRNILFALKFAQLVSVNSLDSIYGFLDRPWVHAQLIAIQSRLGPELFPLIEQNYYPDHQNMMITPGFPVVAKVGHAHAGYGKMIIKDHHAFSDFAGVVAVGGNYSTAEPYYEGEYDIRIQKIGPHYRAFKRVSMSGNWKTNVGTSVIEPLELTEQYRQWADEAAAMFGGLDILSVDAIHTSSGQEYILEVNGTSTGFLPDHQEEDMCHVAQVMLHKMADRFPEPKPKKAAPQGFGSC